MQDTLFDGRKLAFDAAQTGFDTAQAGVERTKPVLNSSLPRIHTAPKGAPAVAAFQPPQLGGLLAIELLQ
jgi:hypothetical protein